MSETRTIPAEPWIKARIDSKGVVEEGGKWKISPPWGEGEGTFDDKAAALKAYRKAAEAKFGKDGVYPTEEDIDQAVKGESPGPSQEAQPTPAQTSAPTRPAQPAQPVRPQPAPTRPTGRR